MNANDIKTLLEDMSKHHLCMRTKEDLDKFEKRIDQMLGIISSDMENVKHNGWTNYETWDVNLWITNDSETHNYYIAIGEGLTLCEFADAIKESIEDGRPEIEASMYSDLLSVAISSVNWYEIAEHLKEDNS